MHNLFKFLVPLTAAGVLLAQQQGWYPHEGSLMKYRVQIRFGEEPDTMPDGFKFGRVSAVAVDQKGEVTYFNAERKHRRWWFTMLPENIYGPGALEFLEIRTVFA